MKVLPPVLMVVSVGVPVAVGCRSRESVALDLSTVSSASVAAMTLAQCQVLWNEGVGALRVFDQSHLACSAASACATVESGWCLGSCDTAVQSAALSARSALVTSLQPKCATWMKQCGTIMPVAVPSCPMYAATCSSGQCVAHPR